MKKRYDKASYLTDDDIDVMIQEAKSSKVKPPVGMEHWDCCRIAKTLDDMRQALINNVGGVIRK